MVRVLLGFAVLANLIFWFSVRHVQTQWTNVPPPPPKQYASASGLGDRSFSYRMNGIMIQNMGDTGGRTTALKDYNFERLSKWFFLEDSLDAHSNHIPYLAGYYFSGSQDPQKYRPVLDYLETIGVRPDGEKWRWLAHAVFMARFKMKDMDRALSLAHKLAEVKNSDMPEWTRQMPAFVMNAKGEKEAAYALMLEILKSRRDKLHPEEVTAMRSYICGSILDKSEAENNPICKNIP